jgi:hypothetical protein
VVCGVCFNPTSYSLVKASSLWVVANKQRPLSPITYKPEIGYFKGVQVAKVTAAALSQMTRELSSHLQFASIPSFLLPADIDDIFLDAEQRYFMNEFHEAGVKGATVGGGGGDDQALQQRKVISTVRKAHIAWLDSAHPRSIVEGRLLRYLDALRVQLGASLSLDLCAEDTESMYVRYPIGGLYTQHSDSHSPEHGFEPGGGGGARAIGASAHARIRLNSEALTSTCRLYCTTYRG